MKPCSARPTLLTQAAQRPLPHGVALLKAQWGAAAFTPQKPNGKCGLLLLPGGNDP